MLLVFGSAKLLDEVFEHLQQPGIVGQIVAGILLGPSVLGWPSPDNFFSLSFWSRLLRSFLIAGSVPLAWAGWMRYGSEWE